MRTQVGGRELPPGGDGGRGAPHAGGGPRGGHPPGGGRAIWKYLPSGSYVALALLTFCAVFAATAGVREALATRTQALRETLAAAAPATRTVTVSSTWEGISSALGYAHPYGAAEHDLTAAQISEITSQLHADYDKGALRLAPVSADWASMTTGLDQVDGSLPKTGAVPVKLGLSYLQPLTTFMRLVAGHFPTAPAPPPEAAQTGQGGVTIGPHAPPGSTPVMQVVVTQQTAATLGLRVGSTLKVSPAAGAVASVMYQVSGIVAPIDPDGAFWSINSLAATATLQNAGSIIPPPYWAGAVIAGPAEAAAVQQDLGISGLSIQWGLPMSLGSIQAQQAQPLSDALTSLSSQSPTLSGDVAPVGDSLTASSDLLTTLGSYFGTAQSVDALLWLLYVGLTVAGLAVLLLAARMVAMRRSAELSVIRARGGSLWQVALATSRSAAVTCIPAAVVAVVLAFVAVPDVGPVPGAGGWWPPIAVLVFAVCGPAIVAAWQHRLPRRRATGRRQRRGRVRLVLEVMLIAASVAGIVVFRRQSATAGSGVNLFTSAAPALVAIPVVIVVLRVYPLVLRGLLRATARTSGAPAFLGLARAARTALTPSLPAFALVLALTVAAFCGMVRDAVTNGDVAASWQAAGTDAAIVGSPAFPNFSISASAERAIAAVPGVTHAAGAWEATWSTPGGTPITAIAVDPAAYATLVAATQGYPRVQAGLIAVPARRGAAQPVLASPAAAAALGKGAVSISSSGPARGITVRVAGLVSATPGWPPGGPFIIMPLAALTPVNSSAQIPVTELLLSGSNIDRAALNTVIRDTIPPGGYVIYRSDVLSALRAAPLQHGAFVLLTLAIAVAAVLGLAVMFLELALGAEEREATLARLATMGLGEGQRTRVVALEVLPAVVAAGLAAWACAVVLPRLVASALNLSVFTNVPVQVPLDPGASLSVTVPLVPDVGSVGLPLAALVVLAAVALSVEIRSGRRRSAAYLRIGG